jgi:hypothetical protein
MTTKKDKKDEIKPLDMTTEEAINFLFPKEVVDELKQVASQPTRQAKPNGNSDLDNESDSAYKYHNE